MLNKTFYKVPPSRVESDSMLAYCYINKITELVEFNLLKSFSIVNQYTT